MKILLVSHWFPPMNLIGAVRPYWIARHLADSGHDVVVLRARSSNAPNNNPLNTDGFRVIDIPTHWAARLLEPNNNSNKINRIIKGIFRQLFFPDYFSGMKKLYLKSAIDLKNSGFQPEAVISSALPFSVHTAACSIAKKLKCNWVADNRDLWANSPYHRRPKLLRIIDLAYEAKILNNANLVTVIGKRMAESMKQIIKDKSKVHVVRNGADINNLSSSFIEEKNNCKNISFVYTGTLYGGVRDITPLLSSLADIDVDCNVDFYGAEKLCVDAYKSNFPNLNIAYYDAKPKKQIKEIQSGATFLVVALGNSDFEKGVLTGKFFEYAECRVPIIAICDEDSELADIIKEANIGIATREPTKIYHFITKHIAAGMVRLPPPPESLSRGYQMRIFEEILLALPKSKNSQ